MLVDGSGGEDDKEDIGEAIECLGLGFEVVVGDMVTMWGLVTVVDCECELLESLL